MFFGFVEVFVLLITGKTLGERLSQTAVVSKNRIDDQMLYFEERQELQERENRIAQEVELHRIVEEKRRLARNGGVPQEPPKPKSKNIYAPENQKVSKLFGERRKWYRGWNGNKRANSQSRRSY